jgi:hypothetical protein
MQLVRNDLLYGHNQSGVLLISIRMLPDRPGLIVSKHVEEVYMLK